MESSLASSAAERTMNTSAGASETAASQQTMSLSTKKRHRKSVKQATHDRIEAKRLKTDADNRYKAAFKEATSIVVSEDSKETAASECQRLNLQHNLDGKKSWLAARFIKQSGRVCKARVQNGGDQLRKSRMILWR